MNSRPTKHSNNLLFSCFTKLLFISIEKEIKLNLGYHSYRVQIIFEGGEREREREHWPNSVCVLSYFKLKFLRMKLFLLYFLLFNDKNYTQIDPKINVFFCSAIFWLNLSNGIIIDSIKVVDRMWPKNILVLACFVLIILDE